MPVHLSRETVAQRCWFGGSLVVVEEGQDGGRTGPEGGPMPVVEERDQPTVGRSRILSWNAHRGGPEQGPLRWRWIALLAATGADLICLQEVDRRWLPQLAEALPDRLVVAPGGRRHRQGVETCPILVDRARWHCVDAGLLWFGVGSGRVEAVADGDRSVSSRRAVAPDADARLPRFATWASLLDRQGGDSLLVVSCHLDHRGGRARLAAARQLRGFLASRSERHQVVAGDLNCAPDSPPYRELAGSSAPLVDLGQDATDLWTWRSPLGIWRRRIDYILCDAACRPDDRGIAVVTGLGPPVSDHRAVLGDICLTR